MGKDQSKIPPEMGTCLFGSIAVAHGYVTNDQIQSAIDEQLEDFITGMPHRLLGKILLDNYLLTEEQVKSILEEMGVKEK